MLETMDLLFAQFAPAAEKVEVELPDHPAVVALLSDIDREARKAAAELLRWEDPEVLAEALTLWVDTDEFLDFRRDTAQHVVAIEALGVRVPPVSEARKSIALALREVFPGRGLSADRARFVEALGAVAGAAAKVGAGGGAAAAAIPNMAPARMRSVMWSHEVPATIRKGIFASMEIDAALLAVGGIRAMRRQSPSAAWSREFIRLFVLRCRETVALLAAALQQPMPWLDGATVAPPAAAELAAEIAERKALVDQLMPGTLG